MPWRSALWIVLSTALLASSVTARAQNWYSPVLPDEPASATAPRPNRAVALFYFLWSCESGETATRGPTDVSRVLSEHPRAAQDPHDAAWDDSYYGAAGVEPAANHHYLHWGKPKLDYYCSADPWVVARHVRMLTAADIDILVLDATNALVYENVVEVLIAQLREANAQGATAPKLVFYTNTVSGATMDKIWQRYFDPSSPKYTPDMAFELDGKPLIIGRASEASPAVRNGMTVRESQWPNEPLRDCGWPWMEFVRPQPVHRCHGRDEIINVSVAQHAETVKMSSWPFDGKDRNWGRGFHGGHSDHSWAAIASGANFAEQWSVALAADPPFVFVTGWNEWIAARFLTKEGDQFMVDLATPEFSRDLEPMSGGWGDAFYRQLIRNVRRYKGAEPAPVLRCDAANSIGEGHGRRPVRFRDYRGDTMDRDFAGAGGRRLVEKSGRNDIVEVDVACNDGGLSFTARTAEPLTGDPGDDWMQLGFAIEWRDTGVITAYRVQMMRENGKLSGMLSRHAAGTTWRSLGIIDVRRESGAITAFVPADMISSMSKIAAVRVKWSDHVGGPDPLAGYVHGDTAPEEPLLYRVRLMD